ncbi:uncharacterized protein KGF55_003687 [Candida pseudojiufengensis]|uniref:uncharacterized protein n=1 Tax=Candida pseudojiufengensis TaxID=497109 RepID=UPI0022253F42|nr:uncharacterized protein KGF55_003687 [Candida pseudojiufengensis]KAI5962611.1 hypothetical protein KGF55_003687 [Candida pseudojiufengensis]
MMELFLKLPKEILALVVYFIDNKIKLEELISIPLLQQLALKARYSKFYLTDFQFSVKDGSIEQLKELHKKYNFKPRRIIGDIYHLKQLSNPGEKKSTSDRRTRASKLNQNVKNVDYKGVEYEIILSSTIDFADFKVVVAEFNIVGIHMTRYNDNVGPLFIPIRNNEYQLYSTALMNMKVEALTTINSTNFQVRYPVSLKKLTLYNQSQNINIDLSSLANLNSFVCWNLNGTDNLSNFNLTKSIKYIQLRTCDLKNLNDLQSYGQLKGITVFQCHNLIDLIKCNFPDSLENINYAHAISGSKIAELNRAVNDGGNIEFNSSHFSSDGKALVFGSESNFPPGLKVLEIDSITKTLELGTGINLQSLYKLSLCNTKNVNLTNLLGTLPKSMEYVKISTCSILELKNYAIFPNSKQVIFSNNKLSKLFKSNLSVLERLEVLSVESNMVVNAAACYVKVDPSQLIFPSNRSVNHKSSKKGARKHETVPMVLPNLHFLTLQCQPATNNRIWDDHVYATVVTTPISSPIAPHISFNGCVNLTELNMLDLNIQSLDLEKLPDYLIKLTIKNLPLNSIKDTFNRFIGLKVLDLQSNRLSYSMLANQTFPASMESLNLSSNSFEDLTCLYLDNCINLNSLRLEKVTGLDSPKGANEIKNLFLKLVVDTNHNYAILSTRNSRIIFEIRNGFIIRGGRSFLNSKSRKRKRVNNDDPNYKNR